MLDRCFTVLANEHRRKLLLTLLERNQLDVAAATEVAAESAADPARVEIQLHHIHLPKLADAGYIDWSPKAGRITRGPAFKEIRPFLELLDDHARELPGDLE